MYLFSYQVQYSAKDFLKFEIDYYLQLRMLPVWLRLASFLCVKDSG